MNYEIKTGVYQHYKGAKYEVLGISQHSETEEYLVVYRALYGDFGLWVRPLEMFSEKVLLEGAFIPRFKLLEEYSIKLGNFSNKSYKNNH